MATAIPALSPRTIQVYINLDGATKKINVVPDPFQISVSKGQDVRWICIQNLPFTVEFNGQNGTPFHQSKFSDVQPWSGLAAVRPDPNKKYKYTVTVGGLSEDPEGVVDR